MLTSYTMQVTAYRAGHVLGACMFEIEIAGMRLLYTGDYSRVPDRHLSAADTPDNPPHIGQQSLAVSAVMHAGAAFAKSLFSTCITAQQLCPLVIS